MQVGPVRIRLTADNNFLPDIETWNIVGDLPGDGSDPDHIVGGGHWDGHEFGDAALDNALGAFTALDAFRSLARLKGKLRRGLRLVAFGNEESQQVGSTNYVAQHEDELDRMALMINDSVTDSTSPSKAAYPPYLGGGLFDLCMKLCNDTGFTSGWNQQQGKRGDATSGSDGLIQRF